MGGITYSVVWVKNRKLRENWVLFENDLETCFFEDFFESSRKNTYFY